MSQDARVSVLEGCGTTFAAELCWPSRDGGVVIGGANCPCYSGGNRPMHAPSEDEDADWYSPKTQSEIEALSGYSG